MSVGRDPPPFRFNPEGLTVHLGVSHSRFCSGMGYQYLLFSFGDYEGEVTPWMYRASGGPGEGAGLSVPLSQAAMDRIEPCLPVPVQNTDGTHEVLR